MHDDNPHLVEILERLTRIEEYVAGGPPRDDELAAPDDPLLKPTDAADYVQSSAVTLERKRREGGGPDFIKTGGRIFYRKSALDRYLVACTRQGTRARTMNRGELSKSRPGASPLSDREQAGLIGRWDRERSGSALEV